MITTYTQLKSEVADWAHREDLTSKMDTFCQLAEGMINGTLRSKEMIKRADRNFAAAFTDLPADMLELIAIEVNISGHRAPLRQVSQQILDTTYSHSTGSPRAYAIIGSEIEIRPAPSDTTTGEVTYYAEVETLTSGSQTNSVLEYWPMIYLAGMMIQLNIYLHDEEQTAIWVSAFEMQVKAANKSNSNSYVLPQVSIC